MTPRRAIAGIRRRAGRLAWRAALGGIAGAAPGRYVYSIVEEAGDPSVERHVRDITLLSPAHVERYSFSAKLPAEFRRSKAFDDRHIYRLRDVCIGPRTGLCWLPGGPILGESYGSLMRLLGWGYHALDEPLMGPSKTVEGPVTVLPSDGYFHWLLESFPATLHALELVPEATVLVSKNAPRYVEESLELAGIERVQRFNAPVRAEEMVLVGRFPYSGFVPQEDLNLLRDTVGIEPDLQAEDAIYVSRRLDGRRPANEAELERALRRVGVRTVVAQSFSLSEQADLFARARLVVGPHGAGLANLVWSRASSLVEVFSVGHFNDCYARLAVTLGAHYSPIKSSTPPAPWGSAPVDEITARVRTIRSTDEPRATAS